MTLLSIVMGVVDETHSLKTTVEKILGMKEKSIEILIVIAPFATEASRKICIEYEMLFPKVKLISQVRKGVGGAYQDGIQASSGEYILLMSSDLETDPDSIPIMLEKILMNPNLDIVATSRWLDSKSFSGYGPLMLMFNYLFQKVLRIVTQKKLTDFTYAFRIYRAKAIKNIDWRESRHGFFLESLLIPLSNGVTVTEIPSKWSQRTEGVRHIVVKDYLTYLTVLQNYLKKRS
jgi:glycosyltransferase involved in cell wall biosynthesis